MYMNKMRLVADIYGVLLEIERAYDDSDATIEQNMRKNMLSFTEDAMEWFAEDKNEKDRKASY